MTDVQTVGFQLTPVGIEVSGVPTFSQWSGHIEDLLYLMESLPWAVGDMLVYGEEHWPEEFAQAIDTFSHRYGYQTLSNLMSVSRSVPPSVRREALAWSYHQAVQSLPTPQQEQALVKAEEEHMDRHKLRNLVRAMKGKPEQLAVRLWCRRAHRIEHDGKLTYLLEEILSEEGDILEELVEGTVNVRITVSEESEVA